MQDYGYGQGYDQQGYQQQGQPDELSEGMLIHSTPQFEAPAGDYNFLVVDYSMGFFQPKGPDSKIPACKTANYKLLVPYRSPATGEYVYGRTTYSLKLTPRLMGVLAKFFEACGAVPEYAEFALDFRLPLGRTGVCAIEQRAVANGVWTSVQDVYRPSQRPAMTLNDGIPFEPTAPNGYGA